MAQRRALAQWETEVGNCEVMPQAFWLILRSLLKWDGAQAPTAIHGPLGLKYHVLENANTFTNCLQNQFTLHGLWTKPTQSGWRLELKP